MKKMLRLFYLLFLSLYFSSVGWAAYTVKQEITTDTVVSRLHYPIHKTHKLREFQKDELGITSAIFAILGWLFYFLFKPTINMNFIGIHGVFSFLGLLFSCILAAEAIIFGIKGLTHPNKGWAILGLLLGASIILLFF